MSLLVVSATTFEIAPLMIQLGIDVSNGGRCRAGTLFRGAEADVLVTGVGQMLCAAHLSRVLERTSYDYVLQAGLAGSFIEDAKIRDVVTICSEALSDLGAEDNGSFRSIVEMGLLDSNEAPFSDGILSNKTPCPSQLKHLPSLRSVTVNRVLSEPHTIAWARDRYNAQVVNMEGASLFYVCADVGVPYVSVRSISDRVGPRDTSRWDIRGAIETLNTELCRVVPSLLTALP